jgi:hypothetical protein
MENVLATNRNLRVTLALVLGVSCVSAASQTHTPTVVRVAICQILVIDSDREGNFRRIEYQLEEAQARPEHSKGLEALIARRAAELCNARWSASIWSAR